MFSADLHTLAKNNENYRNVIDTTKQMQLVVMNLSPQEEIGTEKHSNATQYIRVEEGNGAAITYDSDKTTILQDISLNIGDIVIIESKTYHNIIAGEKGMKISTLYSPPQHPQGLIQEVKPTDEDESEYSKSVLDEIREYISQSYKYSPLYELLRICRSYLDEKAFFFSDIFNMLLVLKGKRPGCLVQTNEDWPHPAYSRSLMKEDMLKYLDKGFEKAGIDLIAYEYNAIYSQARYSMLVTLREKFEDKFPDLVLSEYNDYFFIYNKKYNPNFETGNIEQKLGYLCPVPSSKKTVTNITYSMFLTDQDDKVHTLFAVKCANNYDKIKTQLDKQVTKFSTVANQYDFTVSYKLDRK